MKQRFATSSNTHEPYNLDVQRFPEGSKEAKRQAVAGGVGQPSQPAAACRPCRTRAARGLRRDPNFNRFWRLRVSG